MEFYSQQTLPGKFPSTQSRTRAFQASWLRSQTPEPSFHWWKDSMGLQNLLTSFLLDQLENGEW